MCITVMSVERAPLSIGHSLILQKGQIFRNLIYYFISKLVEKGQCIFCFFLKRLGLGKEM